jgi:hypothetical protein
MMKKWVFVIGALFIIAKACKKCNNTSPAFIGAWIWQYSVGGINVQTISAGSATVVIQFKSDLTYRILRNDTLMYSGVFQVSVNSNGQQILKLSGIVHTPIFSMPNGLAFVIQQNQLIAEDYLVADGSKHYFKYYPYYVL